MSNVTKIQWCDSTVNPIMGCGGCELFPSPGEVLASIDEAVGQATGQRFSSQPVFKRLVEECFKRIDTPKPGHKRTVNTTNIWHLRKAFHAQAESRLETHDAQVP